MKLVINKLVDEKYPNKNQFAKEIRASYQDMIKLYDGKTTRIYFETLERICIALDCTPNDILIMDKEKSPY